MIKYLRKGLFSIHKVWRWQKSFGKLLRIVTVLFCLLVYNSCYSDVIEEELSDDTEISFSDDIIPIFENTCISCHGSDYASPVLTSAKAYESLMSGGYIDTINPESSKLVEQLNDDHPYEGALTNTELKKIVLWIEQGANDN